MPYVIERGLLGGSARRGSVCPEDMWQLLYLFPLSIVQSLLESTHYDLVNGLGLAIPLGIGWGRVSVLDSQVTAVSPERFAIELKAVVRDEGMRDSESGDNVFPHKLLGVYVSDICQGLSFNPFDEVVRAD